MNWPLVAARELQQNGVIRVEDGNHGEYRPRPGEFVEVGTAFVRAADLRGGRVDFRGASRINDAAMDRIRKGVGQPLDVLLTHKGTVGTVALAPPDSPPFVCSPQTTFWRAVDPSFLSPGFLFAALRSSSFQQQLDRVAHQTDMAPYASLTDQLSISLPMPPIKEQQAIAEVLGALDDKIAANAALVRTTTDLSRALTQRSLCDADVGRLDGISTVTMGSSPVGTSYNETRDGIVMYQGTRDFGTRYPTPRVFTTSPVRLAHANDVLISVRAPVGALNMAAEDTCIGRGLAAATSPWPNALYFLLEVQSDLFAPFNTDGTIFGSINKDQLNQLPLKLPTDGVAALQAEIEPLEAVVRNALCESETLAELRDTLLPALMDGTIRVKDAVAAAEGVL